ncbi:hypothetical protein [Niveispirillum sp. KHB5.9]|uniref:hypothetical protein n=1 Tax=Niveispirillum sp. KHB5.9 TaxID=3400269 RepID=UPI003A8BB7FB
MKSMFLAIITILALAGPAVATGTGDTYSFLFREDRGEWCGFRDAAPFDDLAAELIPLESGRVSYLRSGKVSEIIVQTQPESGDWLVLDTYVPKVEGGTLARTITFAQDGVRIDQQGNLGRDGTFSMAWVKARKPDGSKVDTATIDIPEITIYGDLRQIPFMKLAQRMKDRSLATLCGKADGP